MSLVIYFLGEVLLKSCKPDVQITREDLIVKMRNAVIQLLLSIVLS